MTLQAFSQESLKEYITTNVAVINSIEPGLQDYTDLEVIGNAIGDARVVMLGEQDHGDAPTFLAKTRLIKYLHEKKGFNVLAFESDFFALNEGWARVPKQEDSIRLFLRRNIFPFWTNCQQCEDLFYNYIPATFTTRTPLQISGFDNQSHGQYSAVHLKDFVDAYLKKQDIPFVNSPLYHPVFLTFLENPYQFDRKEDLSRFLQLERIADTILNQLDGPKDDFALMVTHSLKAFFKQTYLKADTKGSNEARDKQMADNLDWLVNKKYAGEKVIVWAANGHVMKNSAASIQNEYYKRYTMGHLFTNDSANDRQTYILGFTSKQGTAGRLYSKPYSLSPVKPNSLEAWIDKKITLGFIDFKPFRTAFPNFSDSFYMKGLWGDNLANWTQVFDGVFYLRDMYPCEERK